MKRLQEGKIKNITKTAAYFVQPLSPRWGDRHCQVSHVNPQDITSHANNPMGHLTLKRGPSKWMCACWLMSVLSKLGQQLRLVQCDIKLCRIGTDAILHVSLWNYNCCPNYLFYHTNTWSFHQQTDSYMPPTRQMQDECKEIQNGDWVLDQLTQLQSAVLNVVSGVTSEDKNTVRNSICYIWISMNNWAEAVIAGTSLSDVFQPYLVFLYQFVTH